MRVKPHVHASLHSTILNSLELSVRSFSQRMIGAALLDSSLYEEVEADQSAFRQAMIVVVISSLATGIGMGLRDGVRGLVAGTIAALLGWLFWSWLTYFIGTRFFPTPETSSSLGELLRTTGFSATPGILRIFSFVPVVGIFIYFIVGIWMLATFVVGVRQALDYQSTWGAVMVCLLGWLIWVFVGVFLVPTAI